MAHAHFKPRNKSYKHTLLICVTYCFSTTTMVTRTRLDVTLYVHCLSCFIFKNFGRHQAVPWLRRCHGSGGAMAQAVPWLRRCRGSGCAMAQEVPWLRRLVTLQSRRFGFAPRPILEETVVGKVALAPISLPALNFSTCQYHSTVAPHSFPPTGCS